MRTTIGLKIGAGYALALLSLIIIGAASYISVTRFAETVRQVNRSYQILLQTEELRADLVNVETGQRGYTITGKEEFLGPYEQALPRIAEHLSTLRALTSESPSQQQLLDRLEPIIAARLDFSKEVVDLQRRQDRVGAVERTTAGDGKNLADQIRQLTNQIEENARRLLRERSDEANANARNTILVIVLGIAGAVVLVGGVGFLVVRSISRPLREITDAAERIASGDLDVSVQVGQRSDEVGVLAQAFDRMIDSLQETAQTAKEVAAGNLAITVKPQSSKDVVGNAQATMVRELSALIGQVQRSGIQVNTSATEIAATARQQQAMTSEISATTSEISATAREISATSQELVKTMHQVATGAEESAKLAGNGQAGLTRMDEIMRQIMTASSSINTRFGVLSEKSSNINTVVTTIAKVADQTNLLSLNAAIEAEKAGEHGRGFAVVASEIRRLADQTAVATLDIEQIVKEMQSAVSAGVMGMEKFSEEVRRGVEVIAQVSGQLTQIIERVQTLAPNIETVNEGMQSQSQGAQQISEALMQLGEAARQTAESLRQSNEVIGQLNDATHGLQNGVSRFQVKS